MIHAYNKVYLNDVQKLMSNMFDYALYDMNIDPDMFMTIFISSKYSKLIEQGNPYIVSGKSGVEVAQAIISSYMPDTTFPDIKFSLDRSPYYWAGYVLSYYQWYTAKRFKDILKRIKISEILSMYKLYHEMDITNVIEALNEKYDNVVLPTNLRIIRENRGLSQSELSKFSSINIRSIQLYEQRVNDIDKAQCQTVYKLALALSCDMEDLLEHPEQEH